jgi:hypothetical protein
MPRTSAPPHRSSASHASDLRRDVVFHQLDDLNALGDALAAADREQDGARLAIVRSSLDRCARALGWRVEAAVPAVLAYVDTHADCSDDWFGPAFVLGRIAPEHAQTAALRGRLPLAVRELLALADAG